MLVDSHCHLDFNDFEDDMDEVIARARDCGVSLMLNAGNNLDELKNQLALSEKYPFVYAAVGVHPHNAQEYPDLKAEQLIAETAHPKVIGIGETGLDYYYDYAPRDLQIKLLREHIKAAQETGLPLIIHNRDSDDDMISVLGEAHRQKPFAGVIHCFSSSQKLADFALSIGFYLSASGIITFNKSGDIRDIFETVPLERLLVETDSPFLAPIPQRGHRNEPSYVRYTAEKLAQLRDVPFEKLAQITSDNFCNLFRKASDKGRREYQQK
ncbi:MAG: TatD family hydrolase [Alphaproteobacteria bacterium]|nr:TatD family hydrolase [Alphaproteobacteria bacterium]